MADEQNTPDDESDAPPASPAWKAPASPEELNEIIERRLARERKKLPSTDELTALRAKAARADELEQANATDLEKALKAARDEERANTAREITPRLVRAEFKAAAKGVLTTEQLNELLEDVDLSRFTTESGEVDEDRIAKKIAALAPKKADDDDVPRFPDLGGGPRGAASSAVNMNDRLRQLAAARNR